jgi:flagellar motor protein MotB
MASTNIDEWGLVRSDQEETEESYFVSMTDIMVGLLFIFIIMLMAFGLMLKIAAENTQKTQTNLRQIVSETKVEIEEIQDVDSLRTQMLRDIASRLRKVGVRVILREENGVLQLPDEILFAKAEYRLSSDGIVAIEHLAQALDEILPCYAKASRTDPRADCRVPISKSVQLEAVFVEGHTDKDGSQEYNWDLSARRAINTFIKLNSSSRTATRLFNDGGQFLFSISGYGENRPVNPGDSEADKEQNRRIDLRFVMSVFHKEALERVQRRLEAALEES